VVAELEYDHEDLNSNPKVTKIIFKKIIKSYNMKKFCSPICEKLKDFSPNLVEKRGTREDDFAPDHYPKDDEAFPQIFISVYLLCYKNQRLVSGHCQRLSVVRMLFLYELRMLE
jgi:hypothetical protein